MRFLIFIKQVPESNEIRFDREKKTLVRDGVKNTINAYDRRAISEAIRYRNEKGGEVIVATMGPPQAREALAESLIMGVDRAIHVVDARLAGSDTLVTARVLAAAARKIGFDLIFCGLHSTDSETGQVPPSIAELLGIPSAAAAHKLEYRGKTVRVFGEIDEGTVVLDLPLPAVISAAERLIKPIKTKGIDLTGAPYEKIETWRLDYLGLNPESVGLQGSPTWVAAIQESRITRKPEIIQAADARRAAERILEITRSKQIPGQLPEVPLVTRPGNRDYWCLVEMYQGKIRSVTLEVLSAAASLCSMSGGKVSAVYAGPALSSKDAALLGAWGADQIYQAEEIQPHPDHVVALLGEKIQELRPFAVLFPATSGGRYLAPRIAARLGLGLTGDAIGLSLDEDGKLVQWKPAFGGNIVAPIYSKTFPQMATVRPGALPAYRPRQEHPTVVLEWKYPQNTKRQFEIVNTETDEGAEAERMNHAGVLVCIGMGLGQENLKQAFELAHLLDGAVGATRRVVDAGWMQRQFQVGLTGKFVAPSVYLGFGVSGRANHMIGVQKAGSIIAINSDPSAEIFQICDLGFVADAPAVAAALIDMLNAEKGLAPEGGDRM